MSLPQASNSGYLLAGVLSTGHDLTTVGNHTATMDNRRCRSKTTECPRISGCADAASDTSGAGCESELRMFAPHPARRHRLSHSAHAAQRRPKERLSRLHEASQVLSPRASLGDDNPSLAAAEDGGVRPDHKPCDGVMRGADAADRAAR